MRSTLAFFNLEQNNVAFSKKVELENDLAFLVLLSLKMAKDLSVVQSLRRNRLWLELLS